MSRAGAIEPVTCASKHDDYIGEGWHWCPWCKTDLWLERAKEQAW